MLKPYVEMSRAVKGTRRDSPVLGARSASVGPEEGAPTSSRGAVPSNGWSPGPGASARVARANREIDVTTIPDATAMLEEAVAQGWSPLEVNLHITAGYLHFASDIQAILDPTFAATGVSTEVFPNWFAFAPHASTEAGRGMYTTEFALALLQAAREGRDLPEEALSAAAKELARRLEGKHVPSLVAKAVGVVLSAQYLEALEDVPVLEATVVRLLHLLEKAPGREGDHEGKVASLFRTLQDTLTQGNRAIYGDIGGAAHDYLTLRKSQGGALTPEQVLSQLPLPGSTPQEARAAYQFALARAADENPPTDFAQALRGIGSSSMRLAAFALIETAGKEPDTTRKNQLIRFANNYLAHREQHDVVAPSFDPKSSKPGEVNREALIKLMTPLVQLPIGSYTWSYFDYTKGLHHGLLGDLIPPVLKHNWGKFEDRWHPILQVFQLLYDNPSMAWSAPKPLPALPTV